MLIGGPGDEWFIWIELDGFDGRDTIDGDDGEDLLQVSLDSRTRSPPEGILRTTPSVFIMQSRLQPSLGPDMQHTVRRPVDVEGSDVAEVALELLGPSAHTTRLALTQAAQTGLPCSARLLVRVLRPVPRRSGVRALEPAHPVLPSP